MGRCKARAVAGSGRGHALGQKRGPASAEAAPVASRREVRAEDEGLPSALSDSRALCLMADELSAPCRLECWPKLVLCMLYPHSRSRIYSEAVGQQNRSYCCRDQSASHSCGSAVRCTSPQWSPLLVRMTRDLCRGGSPSPQTLALERGLRGRRRGRPEFPS
jgi:hypothetical protein